jgi:hypothetical protein
MINRILKLIFSITFIIGFSLNAYAATGAASVYKITISKVELCETGSTISNCLNPIDITIGGGVADVDIAAVTAGASAGTVADFSKASSGKTYTYLQAVISRSMKIKGSVGSCYTKNNGVAGTANGFAIGTQTASDEAEVTLLVPEFVNPTLYSALEGSNSTGSSVQIPGTVTEGDTHIRARQPLTAPYTAKAGIAPTVFLAYDTSAGIMDTTGTCGSAPTLSAAPPSQTITIQGQ